MAKLLYTDGNGIEQRLDKYHLHELLDRLHIMQNIWESTIQNHPACETLMKDKAETVQVLIGRCYQAIGKIAFDKFKG
jgi:hypothetical protein